MTSSIPSGTAVAPTLTPLVDAALTEVTGSVIGGGAPDTTGPGKGIPPFVQQYLDADPAKTPSAAGGYIEQQRRDNEAPSKKGGASTGTEQSRRGQSATCCPLPAPPSTDGSLPPGKANEAPSKKGDGPRRYRHLPEWAAPGKGTPPMKTPPTKGEPPMKAPPGKADGPAPVLDPPAAVRTYTTVRGDNLSQIAEKFDISWRQLFWANRDQIENPDLIYAGQALTVPSKDLQVPEFAYTPTFTPGIRSETAGTGTVTTEPAPAKEPEAPTEAPTKAPDALDKAEPAPPKDSKSTPTPDSPGEPPSPSSEYGQVPPPPSANPDGLPPALPS